MGQMQHTIYRPIPQQRAIVCLSLSTVCNLIEIRHISNSTSDKMDMGSLLTRGPSATLNDILLRIQQHDQEQRFDAIQQLQQREQLQLHLQRQTEIQREITDQLHALQKNMTAELERVNLNVNTELHWRKETYASDEVLGCFKDTVDHDLPYELKTSDAMTQQLCAKNCSDKGYKYAGIQAGVHCFCGNQYGRHGPVNLYSCNKTCPGDQSGTTKCGGVLANTIIRIGVESDTERILVQQHYGGTNFFGKTWVEFKSEFGELDGNYWIGNERLHQLTKNGHYMLRLDMLAKTNNLWYWAEYKTFRVYNEASGYTLNIGDYTGSAGDSLAYVNGRMFSTKDKDQDTWANNCAADGNHGNGGGFWYHACAFAYPSSPHDGANGFTWHHLPIGSAVPERKLLVFRMTLIPK